MYLGMRPFEMGGALVSVGISRLCGPGKMGRWNDDGVEGRVSLIVIVVDGGGGVFD